MNQCKPDLQKICIDDTKVNNEFIMRYWKLEYFLPTTMVYEIIFHQISRNFVSIELAENNITNEP